MRILGKSFAFPQPWILHLYNGGDGNTSSDNEGIVKAEFEVLVLFSSFDPSKRGVQNSVLPGGQWLPGCAILMSAPGAGGVLMGR